MQIKTGGWKQYYNDSNYTVMYNEDIVSLLVHTGNVSTTSNWQEFHIVLTHDWIKPNYHITTIGRDGSCLVRVDGSTGKIGFKNVRNATESIGGVFAEVVWKLR